MIEAPVRTTSRASVEENLRAEMAQGDALAETVQPILPHLLGQTDSSIFGDEILARMRGMLAHLASQLLDALTGGPTYTKAQRHDRARVEAVTQALRQSSGLLAHLHALALEWQLMERLQQGLAVDPVAPPLIHSLLASPGSAIPDLALKFLAAQARWHQSQRGMHLALMELPAGQLDSALEGLRSAFAGEPRLAAAEARIRSFYDEEASRVALAHRLLESMGSSAADALDISHAGATLLITALALGSGQTRDRVCLSTHRTQATRLALTLRAAGLACDAAERQVLLLQAEALLPRGLDGLSADRAAVLLSDPRDGEL